jgi:DNA polymerase I-like protein with 3'-5' exonuclease and polymerase domains
MKIKTPKPVTIDFETDGIQGRPHYPPKPLGLSIMYPGKKAKYYAFDHGTANNCLPSQAIEALTAAYVHPDGVLFQNAKFDIDVAEVHLGVKPPRWDMIHDTMYLLYLDDPHQSNLSLKPSAERLLGIPPEEQDAVCDWLLQHQPVPGVKISKSKTSEHYFMKYLRYAPGDLVGKYADGDVIRTKKLFDLLYPKTIERGMKQAYDRERQLMPMLLDMERNGVPVDLERLHKDVDMYGAWENIIDAWVVKHLKAPADINLDSGEQLMAAMIAAGKVDESQALLTPGGKYQTNKEALLVAVTDKTLLAVLKYRTQLKTCLNTFMRPWLKTAIASKGKIFTTWNQIKNPDGVGTKTGRLSSTPNFQNIPNTFDAIFRDVDHRLLPKCPWADLPPLPVIRGYIVPLPGHVLVDRDYSQQEPRIMAHFEGGVLMQQYQANPWMDVHDSAQAKLAEAGKVYDRKPVKNTNLGLIYGQGAASLAVKNNMTVIESKELKAAILKLYPGLKEMYKEMKRIMIANETIRTWGGREYYCEPAKLINGRMQTFDYKMVNILIQGSAADCTKEAIIRLYPRLKPNWYLILNVHDQLIMSVPAKYAVQAMGVMREAMESVEFDVLILTEGKVSQTNWAEMKEYDKKGKLCEPNPLTLLAGPSAGTASTANARKKPSTSTSTSSLSPKTPRARSRVERQYIR